VDTNQYGKIQSIFRRYRGFLLFNKNMIISGTVAFFVSALVTQIYAVHSNNDLGNSVLTILAGYGVSIPIFAVLFHYDNRYRYTDPNTGKVDNKIMNQIYKRLIAVGSVSDIIYVGTRFLLLYYLLQTSLQPFEASMISSVTSSAFSYASINIGARKFKLFGSASKT
jgi:hypothetical protein